MRKGNKKVKGKARLQGGGLFKSTENLTQAGNISGLLGNTADPLFQDTNIAGKTGTGALKGVAAGSIFGPAGMIVGGLAGGVTGLIGAKKAEKAEKQAQAEQQQMMSKVNLNTAFANAGNQFKHGGRILAKKLNVVKGGNLSPISDDAVEVKANQPSKSDSVELDSAFVDHNEVIDRKKRVYSDSIFLPNGKSIAKEAKRLEKQKAEDYETRFASANKHIDSKLDRLFEYQESNKTEKEEHKLKKGGEIKMSKGDFMKEHKRLLEILDEGSEKELEQEHERQEKEMKEYMRKGGKIHLKPENKGKFTAYKKRTGKTTEEALHSKDPHVRKMANFAKNAKKWKHENGGVIGEQPIVGPPTKKTLLLPPGREQFKQEQFNKFDNFYEQKMNALVKAQKLYGVDSPQAKQIMESYQTEDPFKKKLLKGGKLKPAYQKAGTLPLASFDPLPKKVDFTFPSSKDGQFLTQPAKWSSVGTPKVQGMPEKAPINWGDKLQTASTALATFGPNLAANALMKRLKGPKSPVLEQGVRLKRLSPDAQLAAASQQTRQAQEIVRRSTAQGSDAVAAQGSLLARRLNANNEIYGATNNANAQIQAQEAGLNQSVRARNVERTNQFRDNQVEFNNKLQQLKSENIANLSSKILQQGRERNIMKLDKEKFDILSKQYSDLPAEMKVRYPTVFDYYNSKEGKKFGGRIKHKLSKNK